MTVPTVRDRTSAPAPVREMRRIALTAPFVLLIGLAILAAFRVPIEHVPFALRLEPAVAVSLTSYGTLFLMRAPRCRDEAEFRAARGWFFVSLGLLTATAAALAALGRGTLGTAAAFAVMLLISGLGSAVVGRGRWLARGQG